jgi:hypothetical protein
MFVRSNEEGQRLLIGTLEAGGQRGAAKRQYRRCCYTLKQELGIDPSPETTDLAERLFANKRPVPAEAVDIAIPPDPQDEVLLRRAVKMLDEAREEIRDNLDHSASLMEALRLDREVLAKLLLRMEDIITSRRVGMKSLEAMRDVIKRRLGDEYLAPAPGRPLPANRPGGTGPRNGEVGVELRA